MTQTEYASRRAEDIDPKLLEFLRSKVNSFVKWDLVRFFHDNPHAADTAENIARYMGRDLASIADELNGLVTSGVLTQVKVSDRIIYRLASDPSIRDLINAFVRACDDRAFRVKAINHVIHSMR